MHLLIPAAGSGRRMGADCNKLLLPLFDRAILAWTLRAANAAKTIEWIGVLGQPKDFAQFEQICQSEQLDTPVELIEGGKTRQESVFRGLERLLELGGVDRVSIHDGARCLATPGLFDRCSAALEVAAGAIAATPVKDTIKQVVPSQTSSQLLAGYTIASTPDRSQLWAAQTPQAFALAPLAKAHAQARALGWAVTDDASLFEKVGLAVQLVMGEETNLKLTTPWDLAIAEQILQQRWQDSTDAGSPL
ncbi:2-C-methyl-D-erythritol 4-phosphate cytidylyltransferase [Synechococcus sp. PCC 7336]|uniref:2-C-methyl-D-erythritol 4-phosphate cytidylyltransferase n=1 Tax=Synechococcus sp. PCC 7336 TaxID=195250 RepID=UPI00034C4F44|nr:2-C-methyl-D-erythritol 4-phosphate cytidylyltransferase [Synechococcus sp. PCC 7336]